MSGLEVLGAIAAASQLVEQVMGVVRLVNNIKDAPKDILDHIGSLNLLAAVAEKIKSNPAYQSPEVTGILVSIDTKVEDLSQTLSKVHVLAEDNGPTALKKALIATWKDENISAKLDGIERDKTTLALCLDTTDADILSQKIKDLHLEVSKLRQIKEVSTLTEEQWRNYCLGELFVTNPTDDRASLIRTKGSRSRDSCTWVIGNDKYLTWHNPQPASPLLWVCGGPGKGKTMMAIFLTEEMEKISLDPDTRPSPLAYFFCDNKDSRRNTSSSLLRGLILQLVLDTPALLDHVLPDFKIQRSQLFDEASFDSLWRVFETVVSQAGAQTIHCVLDAVDELKDESLKALLEKLQHPPSNLKLVVFSRHFPTCIKEALQGYPTIRLDPDSDEDVTRDISNYVTEKVDELSRIKGYPPGLKENVQQTLQRRSQGTFLWVGFAVQILKKVGLSETESCLNDIPPGLDALYARILLGIEKRHSSVVASMLTWVTLAVRPLSLEELGMALQFQPGPHISLVDLVTDKIRLCGGFLIIDKNQVMLVHQSASDYLRQEKQFGSPPLSVYGVNPDEGHCEMAKRCLETLISERVSSGTLWRIAHGWSFESLTESKPGGPEEKLSISRLLIYASPNWILHARASQVFAQKCQDVFRQFLIIERSTGQEWFSAYFGKEFTIEVSKLVKLLLRSPGQRGDEFVFATALGLSELALSLWPKPRLRELFKRSLRYENTGLLMAAAVGNEDVVRFLLHRGVHVDAQSKKMNEFELCIPLHLAVESNRDETVKLLLESGASVDKKDGLGMTPLHRAAYTPRTRSYIDKLIKASMNVSVQDFRGNTALHYACSCQSPATIQNLLEAGADARAIDNDGDTPLHWLSMRADSSLAEIIPAIKALRAKGADVDAARKGDNATPLHKFASRGNLDAVKALLECGANLHVEDASGKTPLHNAAGKGVNAVVRLLLQWGAKTEGLDHEGRTPRSLAEQNLQNASDRVDEAAREPSADDNEGYRMVRDLLLPWHRSDMRRLSKTIEILKAAEEGRLPPDEGEAIRTDAQPGVSSQ